MSTDRNKKGFTLVEMAIVLVIVGVVVVVLMPPLINMIKQGKQREGKTDLTSVKDQIIGYAMELHTHQGDNKHILPMDLAAAGINAREAWGRQVNYTPNPAFAETNDSAVDICDATTNSANATHYVGDDVLRVQDQNGNIIDFVAFVVSSNGHDHQMDVDLTPAIDPGAPPFDVSMPVDNTQWQALIDLDPTNSDDDLVQFVTLLELKALICTDMVAGGGGGEEPERSPHDPYVPTREWPETNPDIIYGDGDSDSDGYDGAYYTDEYDVEHRLGNNGTDNNLATVVSARWFAQASFNIEITAKPSEGTMEEGSLPLVWNDGDLRIDGSQYLKDNKDVPLDFELSYNIIEPEMVFFQVGDLSLNGTLPAPPANHVRLVGNFWIVAKAQNEAQDVEINITDINNFELPGEPITDPFDSGDRLHAYVSQRDEAVEDMSITGDVRVFWPGGAYPNSAGLGMQINFAIHDIEVLPPTP